MKLKGLAPVPIAVLLLMSGAANAAGINTPTQSRKPGSAFTTGIDGWMKAAGALIRPAMPTDISRATRK